MPRGIYDRSGSKELSSEDVKVGQDRPVDMPVTGSVSGILTASPEIEVVDSPLSNDYAAQLAFNEEYVDVVVHESTNPNDQEIFDVYCNGVPQWFKRGETQTVKRKYVEILARARQTSIATRTANSYDGEVVNRIDKHTAVRYPFSVIHDSNPKGRAWLKSVLASA